MAGVLRLDPSVPGLAMLLPFLAERVRLYASEFEPRVPPDAFAALTMGRIWARDPSLLALGLVDAERGTLVGHVLAEMSQAADPVSGQTIKTVTILQTRADGNVGDALSEARDMAAVWGASNGAHLAVMHAKRDARELEKRHGYKHGYHVLYKALGAPDGPTG